MLTLTYFTHFSSASIADLEQVNVRVLGRVFLHIEPFIEFYLLRIYECERCHDIIILF